MGIIKKGKELYDSIFIPKDLNIYTPSTEERKRWKRAYDKSTALLSINHRIEKKLPIAQSEVGFNTGSYGSYGSYGSISGSGIIPFLNSYFTVLENGNTFLTKNF